MNKWESSETTARLVYRLRGLGVAAAVLHVGAHPDDEDIGLLAYLACKFGVRAVYWSATRGEGGQNRIGPYRDEALGIYRTWESLAARAVDQSECLFGPFYDFGYCKNAEAALAKWGRDNLVREVVRAIRLVQPHIIVTRWAGVPGDFHGHHQAVGLATLEAFRAAGDPARFPDLADDGLFPWQPLKLYHSLDNTGGDLSKGGALNCFGCRNPDLERDGVVPLNTGEFDPVSGLTYQERAWLAYNQHQTQAMGLAPTPGDFYYYFALNQSLVPVPAREESLFDGFDPSLPGLARLPGLEAPFLRDPLAAVKAAAREALKNFRADDPLTAADGLLKAISLLRQASRGLEGADLPAPARLALMQYLDRKTADAEAVLARCLGLELEALSDRGRVTPGQTFHISTGLWNQGRRAFQDAAFELCLPRGWDSRAADGNPAAGDSAPSLGRRFQVSVPEEAELTSPYWLARPRDSYRYHWPRGEPAGRPLGPPPVLVRCRVDLGGQELTLHRAAVHRQAFPGGFRELPVAVVPPISLHPRSHQEFLQHQNAAQELELHVVARNNGSQAVAGTLELTTPPGWQVAPGKIELLLSEAESTRTLRHTVAVPPGVPPGRYPLQYRMRCGARDYGVLVTPVRGGVPGIPALADASNCVKEEFIITPSQVTVHLLAVEFVPRLRYAYVAGAEEKVAEALKPFGVRFHFIQDDEMGYLDLSAFDAIVIGPNAYLVREELRKYARRFLEYVQEGGILIVQYQGYGYQGRDFAPYPFAYSMPHDRVTNEAAPVTILAPDHVLFRLPNPVGDADFEGWVHDRGLYFFGQWDRRYQPLLASSDPEEPPREGGLLECQYGRGTYLYTGYSFFRQLPAGVPGAFRLFANLLALPEARILERIDFLKKISLFSLLSPEQLDAVARLMSQRWLEDGAYICRQGEMGGELYVVYRGSVEVVREADGAEQVVFVARAGDSLGEMAVLGDIPRTASLRARGGVELLVIEGPRFHELLRQNPDMSLQMIKLLVNRLVKP